MARTTDQAHTRLDLLEPRVTKIETTVHIQFKEVFARIKRLEAILIAATAAIIALLINIILTMPLFVYWSGYITPCSGQLNYTLLVTIVALIL